MPRRVLMKSRARPMTQTLTGVIAAAGTLTSPTTTNGTNVLNLASAGFSASEPLRALLLFCSSSTSFAATNGNGSICQGFVTNDGGSIQQGFNFVNDVDATATGDVQRGINTTAALRNVTGDATVLYTADCTAFTDTGATFNLDNSARYRSYCFLLGVGRFGYD